MKVVFVITVFCFTAFGSDTCSNEDQTLLSYIKWQMKTTNILKEGSSGKCKCKTEERRIVAFNAILDKYMKNLPANSVVKFGKVTLNEGNGYNPSTGVFTCPVDGIYSFSWSISAKQGSSTHTHFRVNGTILAYNYCAGHSKENNSSSKTVVVKLKKGDNAWVQVHGSYGNDVDSPWSSFAGTKI